MYEITMKGQVVADFIVDHAIEMDLHVNPIQLVPWRLHFDGSVYGRGQGAGCVITSPSGVGKDLSIKLEFACTNNQAEYESLLRGLEYLRDVGASIIDVFDDSNLVVQQIWGDSQCLHRVLNSYLECCLDIIRTLDTFSIKHITQEEK
jgi:ribonuclease HI